MNEKEFRELLGYVESKYGVNAMLAMLLAFQMDNDTSKYGQPTSNYFHATRETVTQLVLDEVLD